MLFTWDIEVPANTLETAPVTETLQLSAGVITRIGIKFPAGCNGMVGVRLRHAESQILPIPRGEWVSGDDEEVESSEHIEFSREKEQLKIQAISPNTDYDHTISVRITMLPAYIALPYLFIIDLVRVLKRLLGIE